MSDENEGLLAYFQRIITKLLASCTTETGFADVSDDYMASMILDSIDRTFLHGRKQEETATTWEVLKATVDQAKNVDLLLAMHTRSLERRPGLKALDKSTLFVQYAIANKLFSSFCSSLLASQSILDQFYFPGYLLSTPEHSAMFLLQLTTLESLNFSRLWGRTDNEPSQESTETGRHMTSIVQTNSTPSSTSSGSGKLQNQPSSSQPAPLSHPVTPTKSSASSLLFGGSDVPPLTFSLKPKTGSTSNPFAAAVAASTAPPPVASTAPVTQNSSSSISSILFASTPQTTSPPTSTATVHASTESIPATDSAKLAKDTSTIEIKPASEKTSVTASNGEEQPSDDFSRRSFDDEPRNTTASASNIPTTPVKTAPQVLSASSEIPPENPLAAQVESNNQATTPGSTKKRAKKRTIEL